MQGQPFEPLLRLLCTESCRTEVHPLLGIAQEHGRILRVRQSDEVSLLCTSETELAELDYGRRTATLILRGELVKPKFDRVVRLLVDRSTDEQISQGEDDR